MFTAFHHTGELPRLRWLSFVRNGVVAVASTPGRWAAAFGHANHVENTIRHLVGLEEYLLRDIGITREDVEEAVLLGRPPTSKP
jgi:hypothetical protein